MMKTHPQTEITDAILSAWTICLASLCGTASAIVCVDVYATMKSSEAFKQQQGPGSVFAGGVGVYDLARDDVACSIIQPTCALLIRKTWVEGMRSILKCNGQNVSLDHIEGGLMQDRHYFWAVQSSSNLILTSSLWDGATQNPIIRDPGIQYAVDIAS